MCEKYCYNLHFSDREKKKKKICEKWKENENDSDGHQHTESESLELNTDRLKWFLLISFTNNEWNIFQT